MSHPKEHTIQGVVAGLLLMPVIGNSAWVVGISVVLIDVDHLIEYFLATGKISIKGMFKLREIAKGHMENIVGLNIFHTLECYLSLIILGLFYSETFYLILSGFLLHHFFDQIYLMKLGFPFVRAFSILEYYFRSKNRMTIKELYQKVNNAHDI